MTGHATNDITLPLFSQWHAERLRIKHNWFDRLLSVLLASAPETRPPRLLVDQWETQYPKLVDWLRRSEACLSPRQLLALPAFDAWPQEYRGEYAEQLHQRFLDSPPYVSKLVDNLLLRLEALNDEVRPFLNSRERIVTAPARERLLTSIGEIINLFQLLPDSVELPAVEDKALPSVLVIDDLLGRGDIELPDNDVLSSATQQQYDELRQAFCQRFGLIDAEREGDGANREGAIAYAYFCAGQRWNSARGLVNDLTVIQNSIERRAGALTNRWTLVLVDVHFNSGFLDEHGQGPEDAPFGSESVIPWLQANWPEFPMIAITTDGTRRLIHEIRENLGVAYIHRQDASARDQLIERIYQSPHRTSGQLRGSLNIPGDIVAEDPRSLAALMDAWRAAHDNIGGTVLITGESGTGKRAYARFIHAFSNRPHPERLEIVNCANLDQRLARSQLFGYYKAAFLGAEGDTPGWFHRADGGTLALDEFADLSGEVVPQLLVTLEDEACANRPIEPQGNRPETNSKLKTHVDVRIIFMTDQPLDAVRPALIGRCVHRIHLPPLRERPADIVPLAKQYLNRVLGKPRLGITEQGQRFLESLDYPENVRQLNALLKRAAWSSGETNLLTRQDLEIAWNAISQETPQLQRRQLANNAPILSPAPAAATSVQPSPAASGDRSGYSLAEAVALLVSSAPNHFEDLKVSEIDEIDLVLKGQLPEVLAILAEWVFFRADDAASAGRYVFDDGRAGRAPQDNIKRVLKFHQAVAQRVSISPHAPAGNSRLKAILESVLHDFDKRRSRSAPITSHHLPANGNGVER